LLGRKGHTACSMSYVGTAPPTGDFDFPAVCTLLPIARVLLWTADEASGPWLLQARL
jgi:hypothetical protein